MFLVVWTYSEPFLFQEFNFARFFTIPTIIIFSVSFPSLSDEEVNVVSDVLKVLFNLVNNKFTNF